MINAVFGWMMCLRKMLRMFEPCGHMTKMSTSSMKMLVSTEGRVIPRGACYLYVLDMQLSRYRG